VSVSAPIQAWEATPKWDLHAHLNGCIRPRTIRSLVAKNGVEIPDGFDIERDLRVTLPVVTLTEYFKPWEVLKKLPVGRSCLKEMVADCVDVLASDGVEYVELRNSPFNICQINDISLEEALVWLTEAVRQSSEQSGITALLVLSISRYENDPQRGFELLKAIKNVDSRDVIVGLDLSGDENVLAHAETANVFRKAKDDLGLGVSIHAGETGIAENIIWAVQDCGADRVGHGIAAAGNSRALKVLKDHDVCVEVCLKSNLLTGGVKQIEKHPVVDFIENDIPFVLCSDNPQVHDHPLSAEFALFEETFGRREILMKMREVATRYAFGQR
jgi:adenosine deaminase